MSSPPTSGFPVADARAGRALGSALRRVGYTEDAIFDLLGDDAFTGGSDYVAVHDRRLPATKLGTAVRLFFLQLPVTLDDAVSALGQRGIDALAATALAAVGDRVVPRARLTAVDDLLLASDGYSKDVEDPPDYVATYTPTARLLDSLTPRPLVRRALDVGTGSGVHALLAARHAEQVVATDVNPRALAYTQLNAALNGLRNVETRAGSLFEPVEGERFDLITCNAPFVVSPERRWAYRDSGFDADEVSAQVVAGAAELLADGGFASLLVSWVAPSEDEPDERALEWAERTGCDAWVLSLYGADPLEHARAWNAHLAEDAALLGAALDGWASYLDALGVGWVSEGAFLLHRVAGRATVRIDDVDSDSLETAGDQIRRAFAARRRLAALRRRSDLLDARLAPATPLQVERNLRRGGRATVVLTEGTQHAVATTPEAAEAVSRLDGKTPLRALVEDGTQRGTLTLARELLELGALRFRD